MASTAEQQRKRRERDRLRALEDPVFREALRAKRAAYKRRYYARYKNSPKFKRKNREAHQVWEERNRSWRNIYARMRLEKLTPEQRAQRQQKQREYQARVTPEQRARYNANRRKKDQRLRDLMEQQGLPRSAYHGGSSCS